MTPVEIPPPDALRERIRAAVAQTTPVGWSPRARFVISIVVVLIAVSIGIALMRPDLHELPVGSLLGVTVGVVVLAAATLMVALSPGSRGLGAPVTSVVALAATTAPLYAIITMMAGLGAVGDGPRVRGCFTMSMVIAGVALAGLTFALRRSVVVAPIARGALLGACAGAWAGLTIHLHCPCGDRIHILLGHALPIALFSLVGALVSPRFLRP
jgi:hypothetical protein